MFYITLVAIGVLALQYVLRRYVIVGLVIPLTMIMAFVVALFVFLTAGESAGEDPFYIRSVLLFSFLASASFLIYYRKRKEEHQSGYMHEDSFGKPDEDPSEPSSD